MTRRIPAFLLALCVLFAGGGCAKQIRKARLLVRANRDFAAENYEQAELEYRGLLRYDDEDIQVLRRLGLVYYYEGRFAFAYSVLQKTSAANPKDLDVEVKLALLKQMAGNAPDARADALAILQADPTKDDAAYILAATSIDDRDAEATLKTIDGLRAHAGDRASYHVAQGMLRAADRDYPGAEAEFQAALKLDPKSAVAWAEMGNLDLVRSRTDRARADFERSASLAPPRSPYRLRYIGLLARTGSAAQARTELDALLAKVPDYFPARVMRMNLAFEQARYDDCAADIEKVQSRDPDNYGALILSAKVKAARGDLPGAVAVLDHASSVYTRSAELKYELGSALMQLGELTRAEGSLNEAILIAPGYTQAMLLLADLDLRKGDAAGAISMLEGLLKLKPDAGRAYVLLTRAYFMNGSLEQALSAMRQATRYYPNSPELLFLSGRLLEAQGRRAAARQAYEGAIQLAPDYSPALEMLVRADIADGRYAEAGRRVAQLVQRYPQDATPLVLRAQIELATRNLPAAEADLEKAAERDPSSQTAYLLLADLYLTSHRQELAVRKLTELADKTQNVAAIMQLAAIHSRAKQYAEAKADYERILAAQPRFVPALNNLAYLYCEHLGDLAQADAIASRARDIRPEDGAVADTVGWIAFRKGELRRALGLLQQAAGKNPAEPELQYHLGMVHYMLGEEEAARAAFRLTAGGNSAWSDLSRRRIEILDLDAASAPPKWADELQRRVAQEPDDPVIRSRLAAIQERLGQAGPAADNYQAVLKVRANDVPTLVALARLYSGPLNDPAKARSMAEAAHAQAGDDPAIDGVQGGLLYRAGDFSWSCTLLEDAVRALPDRPDLKYELARSQYYTGRLEDAGATLEEALASEQPFAHRADALSLAALTAGSSAGPAEAQSASAEADRVLAADARSVPALYVRALVLEDRRDFPAAQAAYRQACDVAPTFSPAVRRLALLTIRHFDDDAKGYDLLLKARLAYPSDPDLDKALGLVFYRRGDYRSAVKSFETAMRRRSGDAEAVYYAGICHYHLHDLRASRADLEQVLTLDAGGGWAERARRALAETQTDSQTAP